MDRLGGGALESAYRALLEEAGVEDVDIEPWRVDRAEDARAVLDQAGLDVDRVARQVDGRFASAFIRARRP